MNESQIAVSSTQAVVGSYTQKELDTLKSTIAKGTTNEQFALFMQTCVSSGLNPFLNQIYCIVYEGQKGPVMSMQIAVEGIVSLAKKHPQYKGFIASEVKEQDEFEIDMVTGEPIHKIKGLGNRGKTLGAFCVAYREGMPNISVVVDLDQVSHLINSSVANTKKMWTDYRDDMLVKHAIKRAFKRQFGIEVAEDEGPVGSIESYEPQRKDITSEASHTGAPKDESPADKTKASVKKPAEQDEAAIRKSLTDQIKAKLKELSFNNDDEKLAYMAEHAEFKDSKTAPIKQLETFLDVIAMHIAEKQAAEDDDLPLT